MNLFIIDNGERYSDHVIWFVEDPGYKREEVETFLKLIDGPKPYATCKIIGHGRFVWFEGTTTSFKRIIDNRWRFEDWPVEEARKLATTLPPGLLEVLKDPWAISAPQ